MLRRCLKIDSQLIGYLKQPTWLLHTARCCYNAVNFLENPHKRHPIARPLGRGMGRLF